MNIWWDRERKNLLKKAHAKLNGIVTAEDLKRNKLTLAEYTEAWVKLRELMKHPLTGGAETICKRVAELFRDMGFKVADTTIGYSISVKGDDTDERNHT